MDINLSPICSLNQKIVLQSRLEKLLAFLDALIDHSDDGDEISKFNNELNVILSQEQTYEFAKKYQISFEQN